jgi:hypothetical protein
MSVAIIGGVPYVLPDPPPGDEPPGWLVVLVAILTALAWVLFVR